MLYWLLYQKLFPYYRVFRIFRYLTFRTAFASLTALLIGLLIGATSLAVLGPAIAVLAVILGCAELILNRLAPVAQP